jgi:hypothetical protein
VISSPASRRPEAWLNMWYAMTKSPGSVIYWQQQKQWLTWLSDW